MSNNILNNEFNGVDNMVDINRSEIMFLYDLADGNPNGDPLNSNKPRMDDNGKINIVSDVRLKRTVRDYLSDYAGHDIFIRETEYVDDKKGICMRTNIARPIPDPTIEPFILIHRRSGSALSYTR